MTAAPQAWKANHSAVGDARHMGPDAFNRTPANLISGPGAEFTPAEIAIAAVDDATEVVNEYNVPIETTGRANMLFRYTILTPAALVAVDNDMTFRHLKGVIDEAYNHTTYIWNAVSLSWEVVVAVIGVTGVVTMSGSASGPIFSEYVDGSNDLYILLWNQEGTWRTGGGGCLHPSTTLRTPDGDVVVTALDPGRTIKGFLFESVEERVQEVTMFRDKPWDFIRITVDGFGELIVTDDQLLPMERGQARAITATTMDKILCEDGTFHPITSVESFTETSTCYDISGAMTSYFCNDGIGASRMDLP